MNLQQKQDLGRSGSVSREPNVGEGEQLASVVAGAGLTLYGVMQRRMSGVGLALLGTALIYRGVTGYCPLYGLLGVTTAEPEGPARRERGDRPRRIAAHLLVHRPADELYGFWRDLEHLPKFMHHLESVSMGSGGRSHWAVKTPRGMLVTWESEVTAHDARRVIEWHTAGTERPDYAGRVQFVAVGDDRTEVRLMLEINPRGGLVAATLAALLGQDPARTLMADLERFKQLMETGHDVAASAASA